MEGRNANPTNEWVVFDHNNKYTALFSAKKISNDDSKKPSNDEEDGGNDNDAVDYETSIDKFAWFLSDGAFKTTNKVTHLYWFFKLYTLYILFNQFFLYVF